MSYDDDEPKRYDILGNPDPNGRYDSERDAAREREDRFNLLYEQPEPQRAGATEGEYSPASSAYRGGASSSSSGCVGLLLVIGLGYWGVSLFRDDPPEELPYEKLDAEGRKKRDEQLKAIVSARALESERQRAEREAAMPRTSAPRRVPSAPARTRNSGVPVEPPSLPQAAPTTRALAPSPSESPSPRGDLPLPSRPPSSTKLSSDAPTSRPPAPSKRPDPSQMPGLAPSPLMR